MAYYHCSGTTADGSLSCIIFGSGIGESMLKKLRSLIGPAFGVLAGFLWTQPAEAADDACRYYLAGDTAAPAEVAKLLSVASARAVTVCGAPEQPEFATYYLASEVIEGFLGVCFYSAQQIFRQSDAQDQVEWSYTPSDAASYVNPRREWMALSQSQLGCPAQGNSRYVSVHGVSEGTFVRLFRFWDDITGSTEAFKGFVESLPSQITEAEDFARFEEQTMSVIRSGATPALVRVALDLSGSTIPYYQIHVGSHDFAWVLTVDYAADGTDRIEVGGLGWSTP